MHQHQGIVLLVDGNIERVTRLAEKLDQLGFQAEITTNGALGLLEAHYVRPDVIVAAGELPILDGFRMVEALRSKPQTYEIPVILIAEGSSDEETARAWKAGADFCIGWDQGERVALSALERVLDRLHTRPETATLPPLEA